MPTQPTAATDEPVVRAAASATPPERMTLNEFCMIISRTDRRVAMIGGFHHDEKKNRRVKDTHAAFAARYEAFQKRPA